MGDRFPSRYLRLLFPGKPGLAMDSLVIGEMSLLFPKLLSSSWFFLKKNASLSIKSRQNLMVSYLRSFMKLWRSPNMLLLCWMSIFWIALLNLRLLFSFFSKCWSFRSFTFFLLRVLMTWYSFSITSLLLISFSFSMTWQWWTPALSWTLICWVSEKVSWLR